MLLYLGCKVQFSKQIRRIFARAPHYTFSMSISLDANIMKKYQFQINEMQQLTPHVELCEFYVYRLDCNNFQYYFPFLHDSPFKRSCRIAYLCRITNLFSEMAEVGTMNSREKFSNIERCFRKELQLKRDNFKMLSIRSSANVYAISLAIWTMRERSTFFCWSFLFSLLLLAALHSTHTNYDLQREKCTNGIWTLRSNSIGSK